MIGRGQGFAAIECVLHKQGPTAETLTAVSPCCKDNLQRRKEFKKNPKTYLWISRFACQNAKNSKAQMSEFSLPLLNFHYYITGHKNLVIPAFGEAAKPRYWHKEKYLDSFLEFATRKPHTCTRKPSTFNSVRWVYKPWPRTTWEALVKLFNFNSLSAKQE